ncbi:Hypothetical protein P9215_16861 [Prochlorococcus marinus str. MIT 9215]|uniref:Uncharacterized protein n=2 Tax=Prochlorococcus marinus TaxID=1219 RepID=A8G6R8_PROM2|nr:Hypothetical protein P9215_16861 [Prochlorococcus marinus str. MIT 9215]
MDFGSYLIFKKYRNFCYLILLIILQKPLASLSDDLGEVIIDDKKVLQHLKETTELDEQDLTSQYIKDFRSGYCKYWFANGGHPIKKVKDFCDENFKNNFESKKSFAKRDADSKCLEAKDFVGCMTFFNQKSETLRSTKNQEKCKQFGDRYVCFNAARGKDMLGLPKITGWTYIENPSINSTMYVDRNSYKLFHKGNYGRFIHLQAITRIYRAAEAGRLPSSKTIGTARTNCYGDDYSINCTTSPAPTFTTPGRAPKPQRIQQNVWDYIIDCQDMTFTRHLDKGRPEKWKPYSKLPWWFAPETTKKDCSAIGSLRESRFMKYQKKSIRGK